MILETTTWWSSSLSVVHSPSKIFHFHELEAPIVESANSQLGKLLLITNCWRSPDGTWMESSRWAFGHSWMLRRENTTWRGGWQQRWLLSDRHASTTAMSCVLPNSVWLCQVKNDKVIDIDIQQSFCIRHQECSSAHVQYQFSKSFKVFKTLLTRRESQWVWKNYESLNCVLKTKSISKTFARVGRFQNTAWVRP